MVIYRKKIFSAHANSLMTNNVTLIFIYSLSSCDGCPLQYHLNLQNLKNFTVHI